MVKLWNGEDVQWRLTLQLDGKAGTLELGDEPRQLLVRLGEKEKLTAEDFADSLREVMGHTPLQVLMGALLGLAVGLLA